MRALRHVLALAGVLFLAACGIDQTGARPSREAAGDGAPDRVLLHGIDLTGVGYTKGDPRAPISIVEFSDFGCPYCGSHARQTLPELDREFIATGKVHYRYVPFVMGMFPNGDEAARAAECAGEQGRFWPMHDTLFVVQKEWKRSGAPAALLGGYARGVGLDAARFAACVGGGEHPRTRVANDRAMRFGIRATPTFFINGQQLEGALPLPQFRELLARLAP